MEHLTVEQMIDFVSLTELNDEAIELSQQVNGHIRACDECMKKVRAFQDIYDELCRADAVSDFERYALSAKENAWETYKERYTQE